MQSRLGRKQKTGGKVFTTNVCDKGLISKIYRELSEIYKNTSNSPIDKWSKDANRQFPRRKLQLCTVKCKSTLNHY